MPVEMNTDPDPAAPVERPTLTVVGLWRYPVKSMQGERLDGVDITPSGLAGDRRWSLFDRSTGLTLTARRVPELLFAQARMVGDHAVEIELPDATVTTDDDVLSSWLGRDVVLRDATATAGPATYEIAFKGEGVTGDGAGAEWVRWQGPTGSFHDSTRTQVSLVSTATMGDWDGRRFRANVIVDAADARVEDAWVGSTIQAGTAVLDVVKQVDRCAIVTRAQPGGIERDVEVLRTINRDHASLLAVGSLVVTPGALRVGDVVTPTAPVS